MRSARRWLWMAAVVLTIAAGWLWIPPVVHAVRNSPTCPTCGTSEHTVAIAYGLPGGEIASVATRESRR